MATVIGDLVVKIGADINGLKKGIKDAEGEFSKFADVGNKLSGFGKSLSTYVTLPILAVGAAAVKMASDVDKGVAEVITLFGATGKEALAMSKEMKVGIAGVSNEVGIAQDAITKGLYNAISAGIPRENVFDFMTVAAKASIAGVTDINTAVDGITTAINAFGLEASEAARVSDSMFAAVQGGKTTFEELSKSLFQVAPAASASRVSLEEVNAALATLTASGVPTSVAATQLSAAFTGLQRPSADLDKVFKALGFQSAQLAIESKGLGFALDAVKKASAGNNGELQKLLGSSEAVKATQILAGTSAAKFAQELERQAKAAGETDKAFQLMQQSTSAQLQKVTTSIQNIAIRLGDALLPAINSVLKAIESMLSWFNSLGKGVDTVVLIFAGFAAAIGPLLIAIGSLLTYLPQIKLAFTLLTGPVGLTVAAIAAFAAAVYLIYENWDGIVEWFANLWDSVKLTFAKFVDAHLILAEKLLFFIPGATASIGLLREELRNMVDSTRPVAEAKKIEQALDGVQNSTKGNVKAQEEYDKRLAAVISTINKNTQAAKDDQEAQSKAEESKRVQIAKTQEAIQKVTKSFEDSMAVYNREIELGVRLDRGKEANLIYEIEALTKSIESIARDVDIDIDSNSVVEFRNRLVDAKAALMGIQNEKSNTIQAVAGIGREIDNAKKSLEALSTATGNAISEKTFNDAARAVQDYTEEIKEATTSTGKLGDAISKNIIGALDMLGDSSLSVGDKVNRMAQMALSAIPGIGTALSSVLGIMDQVGLGLDDLGRMFVNAFKKPKVGDNAADWFREIERIIRNMTAAGIDAGTILADLKIQFPDISEKTLKALVDGTSEAFADYNRWLATPNNGLWKGAQTMSDMLIQALEGGLSGEGSIQAVIGKLFAMSSKEIEKIFNIPVDAQKAFGYEGMTKIYTGQLQLLLDKLKEFGVDFNKSWEDIIDPVEQAAIELEASLVNINKTLDKNLLLINERLKAGLITKEMADTSILREYEKAINDMLDAGLKSDDPRVIAMLDAWKALGGGAKGASEDTKEATDEMAKAIKKQEEVYAASLAAITKIQQENAALVELGVKSQEAAQREMLRAYEKAIEDLVSAGLKSDDPRLMGMVEAWKALGGSVENTTTKVKDAVSEHEKAAAKLQSVYDILSVSVASQMEKIRQSWESGALDGLKAMQDEAVLLRDAIESMIRQGMNADDPRIANWQNRLSLINENLRDLGEATYDVIEPTDKVGLAWRAAGDRLNETLDHIEKRNIAGLFEKSSESLREQANAYKRAIEEFLKAGDPDDPRIQGWLEALRRINEELTKTGDATVELRTKFEIAADKIREKLDEKLGNIEYDMRFNFEGAEDDLDVQIEKTKLKMKALNDAIIAAGQAGFDKQDELIKALVDSYNELFDKLNELEWQKTQEGVSEMFDVTFKKLDELEKKYKLFGDTQEYLASKMALLKKAINEMISEGIDPEDDRLLELSKQYKEAAEAAKAYAESQKQIEDAIKSGIGVGPDQQANNTILMKLGEAALELWGRVNSLVQQTAGEAVLWLVGWSSEVLNVFKKALEDSRTFREKVIAEQSAAMSNGLEIISTAWSLAEKSYAAFVKDVKEDLRSTLPAIHNAGIGYGSAIEQGMSKLIEGLNGIEESLITLMSTFSTTAKGEFTKTENYAKDMAAAMVEAFNKAAAQIKTIVGEIGTVVLTFSGDDKQSGTPAFAQGGLVSAAMMAMVGDNAHASTDPEVISPLSKLKSMLVDPTLDAVSSMMGGGNGTTQVIYVNLDGRVLSQSVFENLPDVVRINNGSTF